jgi:hypothetical protein
MISAKDLARFESKVSPEPNTGCWLWGGGYFNTGYGQFCFLSKSIGAHRFSYLAYKGDISGGLFVCHLCDNKSCVNPDHLWLGTPSENMRDRDIKSRQARQKGEAHGGSKLSDSQIIEIRRNRANGLSMTAIGKKYGVAFQTISKIVNGKLWSHVQGEE